MSATDEEVSIAERVAERPKLEPGKIRKARPRDLGIRFVAGAATSIASGVVTLVFGAGTGGILLAFPASSPPAYAESRSSTRGQRRGTGGCARGGDRALTLFAAVAAITLVHLSPVIALLLASVTWLAAAILGYVIAWFK
jgi:hypothetical protein